MTTDNRPGDNNSDQAGIVRSRWHQWWTKAGPVKTVAFMTRPVTPELVPDGDEELRNSEAQTTDTERWDRREPVRAGSAHNCTFEVF